MAESPAPNQPAGFVALVRAFRHWSATVQVEKLPLVPGADADELGRLALLGSIAAAVAGPARREWPEQLRAWSTPDIEPPAVLLDLLLDGLGHREDPLAALYNASISPGHRRRLGTVFTPPALVDHMVDLGRSRLKRDPKIVVDPGAGVGAFTLAAVRRWPEATIVAVDVNQVTLGLLATRLAFEAEAEPELAPSLRRVKLVLGDYLDELDSIYGEERDAPVLALGNPPYTRLQEMSAAERVKAGEAAGGLVDSGHANLAMLFLAATLRNMRADDGACLVLPGSFSYTRAGQSLRNELWGAKRSVDVHWTPAASNVFPGRAVQAAVLTVGPELQKRSALKVSNIDLVDDDVVEIGSWTKLRSKPQPVNWFEEHDVVGSLEESVALGEIATIRRGIATGASGFFFLTDSLADLIPKDVVIAGMPNLRQFHESALTDENHATFGDASTRRWLLAIPLDFVPTGSLLEYIELHRDEVVDRYLVKCRSPWYSLTNLLRPDLLISPLSKAEFKIVVNTAKVVPSNNLFGISVHQGIDAEKLADWLRSEAGQAELRRRGRRYPGGSLKLEPGALRHVEVPAFLSQDARRTFSDPPGGLLSS